LGGFGYNIGDMVSTRIAFGQALAAMGKVDSSNNLQRLISCDAETSNSTMAHYFQKVCPDQFVECFIAEQNMCGVAQGFAARGRVPYCSTFSAFMTRMFDQIRIAGLSKLNCKFAGSHVGVSIGEDGPTQMALEDLGMFRSLPGSVVFYPSCGNQALQAMVLSANRKGVDFIRTNRPKYPVIYDANETFQIGKCKVVKESDNDLLCIVTAGVPLHESLIAYEILANEGINVRIVDLFTIKPIDPAVGEHVQECDGIGLVIEEHYPEGGIFDAVNSALAQVTDVRMFQTAVNSVPRSGPPDQLLDMYNLSGAKIAQTVKAILDIEEL